MLASTETTSLDVLRPGLVEFNGIARALGESTGPILRERRTRTASGPDQVERIAQPFWLEDGRGRVKVDPGDAAVFDSSAVPGGREPQGLLFLSGRVEEDDRTTTRSLLSGDRVYVFGTLARDGDGQPVVRPRAHPVRAAFLDRLLFLVREQIASRDPRHLFVVADGPEARVHDLLGRKIRSALIAAAFWIVPAVLVLASTVLQ